GGGGGRRGAGGRGVPGRAARTSGSRWWGGEQRRRRGSRPSPRSPAGTGSSWTSSRRPMPPDRRPVRLAPSILAADFARLGEQVADAERAGADRIHVDVMDGHFVPNLSMGAAVVRSLRRVTRLPLEAHLMSSNPDFFLHELASAGHDSFPVHWEGNNDLARTVQRIKALGKRVGVAINPATSAAVLEEIMQDLDQILVMTVNPGFGHQHFLPAMLPKIGRARE